MKAFSVAELAQTLFEEAGDALFLFDPESEQLLDTNPMAQRLSGFSRQDLLRMRVTYLFRSEGPGGLQRLRHAFRKTGLFHSQEGFVLRHQRDGVWIPVNLTVTRLHAESDTLGLVTARDLREQREAQTLLRKKEVELNRVLASVSDGLWSALVDRPGKWRLSYCSPVVEKITGRPPAFFADGPDAWLDITHAEDRPRMAQSWQRIQDGQTQGEQEYRILRPDGSVRWVRDDVTVSARTDAGVRLDGVLSDVTHRKDTEQSLRESELRFRTLADSAPVLIWMSDPDGQCTYFNRTWLDFTGRTLEQERGDGWMDGVHADDRDRCLWSFAEAARDRRPFVIDYRLRNAAGAYRWVLDRGAPRFLPGGDFAGNIGCAVDMTERKEAEKELRASEERYRLLFQRNLAGVFRSTLDGRLLDCNDAFARIMGYARRDDILDQPVARHYFNPSDRDKLLDRLRAEAHLASFELCMRRRDGLPVWVLENVSLLSEPNGEAVLEGTIVDITERKRGEQAVRASEAKYRSLIENLEQCVFLKDRTLRFVAANRHFCEAVGCAEAELIGKNDFDFYPAHLAEKYRRDDLMVLNEARRLDLEEQNVQAKKTRTVRVVKTPVKDDRGHVVGVLGIFWDVTEQLALEAQLRQAQKMEAVGQLAGGVAHDFNNLLTVILGNLSFALSRPSDTESVYELLRNAEQAGLRAAELTQRLLGFSRRTMLRAEPCNLNRAVEEAARLLGRTLDPRIRLEARPAEDLWPVKADPGQINQVLMNLALNARDAMSEGGCIVFETANFVPDADYLHGHFEARPGDYVRLRVTDTGHGMAPEVKQRIFEPFFTTKETGKGTGLGLAMVFGIIEQHRGWIECDSTVGAGTRFDIFLPRHTETPVLTDAPQTSAVLTGHETILLVDDEALVRSLGQKVLGALGYNVVPAEDGPQAIELVRRQAQKFDLIILDGSMPRLSGRDSLIELVKIDPSIRVLFSSGYAVEHHRLAEFPQVVGYLNKPYRMDELAKTIRDVLDRTRK